MESWNFKTKMENKMKTIHHGVEETVKTYCIVKTRIVVPETTSVNDQAKGVKLKNEKLSAEKITIELKNIGNAPQSNCKGVSAFLVFTVLYI